VAVVGAADARSAGALWLAVHRNRRGCFRWGSGTGWGGVRRGLVCREPVRSWSEQSMREVRIRPRDHPPRRGL